MHFKDVLLIAFSISCSLLALTVDRSKIVKKNMKKAGITISALAGLSSGFCYFFVDGRDDVHVENGIYILYVYLCMIFICSIMGYIIGNNHDKYIKQCESLKENNN